MPATSLAWKVGGCEVALTEIVDHATLTRETECKLVAAFDAIYWLAPHLGVDLRLSGGSTLGVTERWRICSASDACIDQPGPRIDPWPDFRLSVGFAF